MTTAHVLFQLERRFEFDAALRAAPLVLHPFGVEAVLAHKRLPFLLASSDDAASGIQGTLANATERALLRVRHVEPCVHPKLNLGHKCLPADDAG